MEFSDDDNSVVDAEVILELVEELVEDETAPPLPPHPFFSPRKPSRTAAVLTQAQTREQAAALLNVPQAPDLLLSAKALPRQGPIPKRKRSEDEIQQSDPSPKKKAKSSEPTKITPQKRVDQFPGHTLIVDAGELFCSACHEPLSLKKSTLRNHLLSEKHLAALKAMEQSKATQALMTKFIEICQSEESLLEGNTLDSKVVAYRVETLSWFMKAGIPVEKVDTLREYLERDRYSLTAAAHMRLYIPVVARFYQEQVKADVADLPFVAGLFDGTSHVGELFAVLVRYWSDQHLKHCQRLIRLRHLEAPMDSRTMAFVLKLALDRVGLPHGVVIGFTKDSAAVNGAAVRELSAMNTINAKSLPCWSHILSRVGKKIGTPMAISFLKSLAAYMSKSAKGAAEWKRWEVPQGREPNKAFMKLSKVRWMDHHKLAVQVQEDFTMDKVIRFVTRNAPRALNDNDDDEEDYMAELRSLEASLYSWVSPSKPLSDVLQLKLQLLVYVVYGRPVASAVYFLEADEPRLPFVKTYVDRIKIAFAPMTPLDPIVQGFIEAHWGDNQSREVRRGEVRQMIASAMAYLTRQVTKHGDEYKIACASEYVIPHRARELLIRGTEHEAAASLTTFRLALALLPISLKRADQPLPLHQSALNAEITAIVKELPLYLARATGVDATFDITEFWNAHVAELPHFARLFKIVGTLQASSAAAERVFSLWQASFGSKDIVDASEEYMEAAIMSQSNTDK